jgi:hypothetical protein
MGVQNLGSLNSASHIRWALDSNQILIIDESMNQIQRLSGFEAALWGWLVLSYPIGDIIRFSSILLNLPTDETEIRVKYVLDNWLAHQLVIFQPRGNGDG